MKSLWKPWEEKSMLASRNELKGTRQVFSFTFFSLMKSKANIITMIIFVIIGLLTVPVMLLSGGSGVSTTSGGSLSGVIIYNETELPIEETVLTAEDSWFSSVSVWIKEEAAGTDAGEELSPEEAAVQITGDGADGYLLRFYTAGDTELSSADLETLEGLLQREVQRAEYKAAGLTDSQIRLLMTDYTTDTETAENYVRAAEEDAGSGYVVQLIYAIVVLMVSLMASSYIVRAVVEEKSSKLVEMLLLNVRPLSLIAGKILAALAYVFSLLILFLVCVLISYGASSRIFGIPGLREIFTVLSEQMGMEHIGAGMIFAMLLSLLLGCLTFAIIAGISGAGCSSMDDISGASTASVFLVMAGYLVSIMVVNLPSGGAALFSSLCPVLSVFCAPVRYAMGNISLGLMVVSWAVQAAVILLLALLCARVYSYLIMYRGNRLTWKDIIGVARKKQGKAA